jgi:predicted cobalt transporter CbtA
LATALLTGAGIALIFLTANLVWRVGGAALIALPHIYGAPHPDTLASDVPATLAADFATASLASNLIFWAILGIIAAEVMSRVGVNRDARPI